jgi:uncharacterized protein (TIGR02996 family)
MQDEPAFLDDIKAAGDDDGPRLIYADYLQERGDPISQARAEFIRVQCALESLPDDAPERPSLRLREEELLTVHWDSWIKPVCQALSEPLPFRSSVRESRYDLAWSEPDRSRHWIKQIPMASQDFAYLQGISFLRGFASQIAITAKTHNGPNYIARLAEKVPLEGLSLFRFEAPAIEATLKAFDASQLTSFELVFFPMPTTQMATTISAMANARDLILNYCRDTFFDATEFLATTRQKKLRKLILRSCLTSADSLRKLLESPTMAEIEVVVMENCRIGNSSVNAIVELLKSPKLRKLDLSNNALGGSALRRLQSIYGVRFVVDGRYTQPELLTQ